MSLYSQGGSHYSDRR